MSRPFIIRPPILSSPGVYLGALNGASVGSSTGSGGGGGGDVDPPVTGVTSLLLHFDSSQLDEVSQEVFTGGWPIYAAGVFGTGVRSTAEFGGAIAGAWSAGLNLTGQPFCFEFRVNLDGEGGGIVAAKNYFTSEPSPITDYILGWQVGALADAVHFAWSGTVTWNTPVTRSYPVDISTGWHAVAFADDGTDFRVYVDGTLIATAASVHLASNPPADTLGYVTLYNALQGFSGSSPRWGSTVFAGQIDEFRLTIGSALYTGATYTVATSAFTLD